MQGRDFAELKNIRNQLPESINFKIKAITIPYFITKNHNTLIFSNKNFSKYIQKPNILLYLCGLIKNARLWK